MCRNVVLPDAMQKLELAIQVLGGSTAVETLNRSSFLPWCELCKAHAVSMTVLSKTRVHLLKYHSSRQYCAQLVPQLPAGHRIRCYLYVQMFQKFTYRCLPSRWRIHTGQVG